MLYLHLLVSVARRVILGTDDQTASLLGSPVDGLDDVYQLLLILEDPVELVIVSGTEIDHHVFISKEEHDCAGVVELYISRTLANSKLWLGGEWEGGKSYVPYI